METCINMGSLLLMIIILCIENGENIYDVDKLQGIYKKDQLVLVKYWINLYTLR